MLLMSSSFYEAWFKVVSWVGASSQRSPTNDLAGVGSASWTRLVGKVDKYPCGEVGVNLDVLRHRVSREHFRIFERDNATHRVEILIFNRPEETLKP